MAHGLLNFNFEFLQRGYIHVLDRRILLVTIEAIISAEGSHDPSRIIKNNVYDNLNGYVYFLEFQELGIVRDSCSLKI